MTLHIYTRLSRIRPLACRAEDLDWGLRSVLQAYPPPLRAARGDQPPGRRNLPYPVGPSSLPYPVAAPSLPYPVGPSSLPYPVAAPNLPYPVGPSSLPYPVGRGSLPYPAVAAHNLPYPAADSLPYPVAPRNLPYPATGSLAYPDAPSGLPYSLPYPVAPRNLQYPATDSLRNLQYPVTDSLPYPDAPSSLPYQPATSSLAFPSAQENLAYLLASPMVHTAVRLTQPSHATYAEGRYELAYATSKRLGYPPLPVSPPDSPPPAMHPPPRCQVAAGPILQGRPDSRPLLPQPPTVPRYWTSPSLSSIPLPLGPSPAARDQSTARDSTSLATARDPTSPHRVIEMPTSCDRVEFATTHSPPHHHVTWPANRKAALAPGPHRVSKLSTRCQVHDQNLAECKICNTGEGDLLYNLEVETLLQQAPIAAAYCDRSRTSAPLPAPEGCDNSATASRSHSPDIRPQEELADRPFTGSNQVVSCSAIISPRAPPSSRLFVDGIGPNSPLCLLF